ncbi:sulfate/molybdate ABC transporter ATP-binding protein [uncultured Megasphaera sp.]|uniref:sulfate/molybdate ABC transporter ATP-binding protein n=1 Tax=Megasphaera massiliensis TaxID=1232428 RepID=UPI00266C34BD|nr:ABC transporter ATP-binding protein [uncultured Megasphaera sp.]
MIDISVYKNWGSFTLDVALHHQGGILGILGASGCGKSKTLQCVAGIETPDEGHISVGGRIFFDRKRGIDVPVARRRVGYLFQHYALFPNMTVEENIRCGVRSSTRDLARKQVKSMMERMRLTGLEGQKPAELSGGQQQRVALARILVNEPDILLLDEPFSALDSYLKEKVITELKALLAEFPKDVILVTHSRDEAYQLCHSIAVLDGGRVSAVGPTKELFANPRSRAAAVLTGCKNIVSARKSGPESVFIPDWQVTLQTEGRPVGDDLCAIGIRAHAFHGGEGENSLPIVITEEIEQPFEWIVKFRYPRQSLATPDIWWRFAKPDRPDILPDRLTLRGDDILLLYR